MFLRNMASPSSGLKSQTKNNHEAGSKQACQTLFHTGFLLGFLFNYEDGGDMFLRNVD
jgi:hypothetical protein